MSILAAKLHNDVLMPAVGLGTYKMFNDDPVTKSAVKSAVKLGYRLIDTAQFYENERDLGIAVQELEGQNPGDGPKVDNIVDHFQVVNEKEYLDNFVHPHGPLSDNRIVFVTGKVWPGSFNPEGIRNYVDQHLKDFNRNSADLILLHWPGNPVESDSEINNDETRFICWKTLEELYHEKKVRAIGVSNYMPKHLKPLLENILSRRNSGDIKAQIPMVNEIEISPVCQPSQELSNLMNQYKIKFIAYSPLGSERGVEYIKSNSTLIEISQKYKKPMSAIIMRWALQRGFSVIPKSSQAKHQEENREILTFELDQKDVDLINTLDEQKRFCPDPYLVD